MSMINFYAEIKTMHITMVGISGCLFFLRGLAILRGAGWPRRLLVKLCSYFIDTLLLSSALVLFSILPATVFENGWLTVKVVMVILYIALGIMSFRHAEHGYWGWLYYVAALVVFALIVFTALKHHPLGILSSYAL